MARKYGVTSFSSGSGMIVNSFTLNNSVEQAEARNEKGQVIDVYAYSKTVTGSASGVLDDASNPPSVGDTFVLSGETYLVTAVNRTESNSGATEISIDFEKKDSATIHTLADVTSSSSSASA